MVKQYPHTLTVTKVNETTRDENGDYLQADVGQTITSVCRAEAEKGSDGFIIGADGTTIKFSWIVYMPLGVSGMVVGSKVTVDQDGETIVTDTVKRYSKGQLNVRIWL